VILTNFHSLGTGDDPDDLLAKLGPDEIDYIVVDEAHIAAAESYQRTFRHFADARTLLMSACFQRPDGKPIDADVVYRYRLIDSIADGNAKNLRVQRFAPNPEQTTYEIVWPDGSREEIIGREALLETIRDERKLARITAKSNEPIRQVMRAAKAALEHQAELLHPVKPPAPLHARFTDQVRPRSLREGVGRPPRNRAAQDARSGIRLPAHHRGRPDTSLRKLRGVLPVHWARHQGHQSPSAGGYLSGAAERVAAAVARRATVTITCRPRRPGTDRRHRRWAAAAPDLSLICSSSGPACRPTPGQQTVAVVTLPSSPPEPHRSGSPPAEITCDSKASTAAERPAPGITGHVQRDWASG